MPRLREAPLNGADMPTTISCSVTPSGTWPSVANRTDGPDHKSIDDSKSGGARPRQTKPMNNVLPQRYRDDKGNHVIPSQFPINPAPEGAQSFSIPLRAQNVPRAHPPPVH